MLHISVDQRRARLAWRHLLVSRARVSDPTAAADALVAVHATDPGSAHLGIAVRSQEPDIAATEDALYQRRTLVRMLGMRRTVFVVPSGLAPVVQAACTRDVAVRERRRFVQFLEDNDLDENWLTGVEAATIGALTARGDALVSELSDDVPELRREIVVSAGKETSTIRVSSRVLFVLAATGHVIRGRPRGTWLSSQYRWATAQEWLGGDVPQLSPEAAGIALARRWLTAFGPGTVDDLRWWTGWTKTRTHAALAALDTVEVDLDGRSAVVLADDVDPLPAPPPWVALLPGLDSTPMGWTGRDWYLGDHRAALFDRSGNIGPTVWCDGRIVGGWAQRSDGEIAYRLLQDVGADAVTAVEAEADRLATCIGDVRVTPRFRTPLERVLSA